MRLSLNCLLWYGQRIDAIVRYIRYSDYKQFCKSRGFECNENSKAFGVRLKRLKLDGFESHRTRNGAFYTFDVAKLKTFYKMNDLMEVEETEETD